MLDTRLEFQPKNNNHTNKSNQLSKEIANSPSQQKVDSDSFESKNQANKAIQQTQEGGILNFLGGLIKSIVRFAVKVVNAISSFLFGNEESNKEDIPTTQQKVKTTEATKPQEDTKTQENKVLDNVSFAETEETQKIQEDTKTIPKNLGVTDTLQKLHEAELENVPKDLIKDKIVDSKHILGQGIKVPANKLINYANPKEMPKLIVIPAETDSVTINLAQDGYASTVREAIVYKDASGKLVEAYISKIFPYKEPLNDSGYMEPIHIIAAREAKFTIKDEFGEHKFPPETKKESQKEAKEQPSKIEETTDIPPKTNLMAQNGTQQSTKSQIVVPKQENKKETKIEKEAPFEVKYNPDIPDIRIIDFQEEAASIKIKVPEIETKVKDSKQNVEIQEKPIAVKIQSSPDKTITSNKSSSYIDSIMDAYIKNGRSSSWETKLDNPKAKLPEAITIGKGIKIPSSNLIEFKTQDSVAPITLVPASTKGLSIDFHGREFYTSINRWTYFYDAEGNRKEGQVIHIYRSGEAKKLPNGDDIPTFLVIENGAEVTISNGKYSTPQKFPQEIKSKDYYH